MENWKLIHIFHFSFFYFSIIVCTIFPTLLFSHTIRRTAWYLTADWIRIMGESILSQGGTGWEGGQHKLSLIIHQRMEKILARTSRFPNRNLMSPPVVSPSPTVSSHVMPPSLRVFSFVMTSSQIPLKFVTPVWPWKSGHDPQNLIR